MKKILNLLLGGVLITSVSVQVVACGNSSSNSNIKASGLNKSISAAQAVANKIKNTDIENLSYSHGTYSTENTNDVIALRTAIENANPGTGLTQGDVDNITFNQKTIQRDATDATEVEGTIKVGNTSAEVQFHFKISNFAPSSGAVSNANITVDPQKIGNTYYIATEDRGLLKSNTGNSWQQVQDIPKIDTPIVSYKDHYYVGTDENGLYESSGDAVSGFEQVSGTSGWDVTKIGQMTHTTDGPFYLATNGHGLRQTSDGSTWTLSPGISATDDIQVLPTEFTDIETIGRTTPQKVVYDYVTSDSGHGMYQRVYNEGATNLPQWESKGGVMPDYNYNTVPVKLDTQRSDGGNYYLGANGGQDSTYQQPNGTGLWFRQKDTLWAKTGSSAFQASIPANIKVPAAPVTIDGVDYLITANDGLWRKTDETAYSGWQKVQSIQDLNNAPVKIGDTYYLTTNGNGLWSSTDGVLWNRVPGIPSDAKISKPPVELNGNGSSTFYVITAKGLYTVQ